MKNKKTISYRIYSKKNLEMAEAKTKLLGVNNKINAVDLLNIRLFSSLCNKSIRFFMFLSSFIS